MKDEINTSSTISNCTRLQLFLASEKFNSLELGEQERILKNYLAKEIQGQNRPLVIQRLIGKLNTVSRLLNVKLVKQMGGKIE